MEAHVAKEVSSDSIQPRDKSSEEPPIARAPLELPGAQGHDASNADDRGEQPRLSNKEQDNNIPSPELDSSSESESESDASSESDEDSETENHVGLSKEAESEEVPEDGAQVSGDEEVDNESDSDTLEEQLLNECAKLDRELRKSERYIDRKKRREIFLYNVDEHLFVDEDFEEIQRPVKNNHMHLVPKTSVKRIPPFKKALLDASKQVGTIPLIDVRFSDTRTGNDDSVMCYTESEKLVSIKAVVDQLHFQQPFKLLKGETGEKLKQITVSIMTDHSQEEEGKRKKEKDYCRLTLPYVNHESLYERSYLLVYGAIPRRYEDVLKHLLIESQAVKPPYVFMDGEIEVMMAVYWRLESSDLIDIKEPPEGSENRTLLFNLVNRFFSFFEIKTYERRVYWKTICSKILSSTPYDYLGLLLFLKNNCRLVFPSYDDCGQKDARATWERIFTEFGLKHYLLDDTQDELLNLQSEWVRYVKGAVLDTWTETFKGAKGCNKYFIEFYDDEIKKLFHQLFEKYPNQEVSAELRNICSSLANGVCREFTQYIVAAGLNTNFPAISVEQAKLFYRRYLDVTPPLYNMVINNDPFKPRHVFNAIYLIMHMYGKQYSRFKLKVPNKVAKELLLCNAAAMVYATYPLIDKQFDTANLESNDTLVSDCIYDELVNYYSANVQIDIGILDFVTDSEDEADESVFSDRSKFEATYDQVMEVDNVCDLEASLDLTDAQASYLTLAVPQTIAKPIASKGIRVVALSDEECEDDEDEEMLKNHKHPVEQYVEVFQDHTIERVKVVDRKSRLSRKSARKATLVEEGGGEEGEKKKYKKNERQQIFDESGNLLWETFKLYPRVQCEFFCTNMCVKKYNYDSEDFACCRRCNAVFNKPSFTREDQVQMLKSGVRNKLRDERPNNTGFVTLLVKGKKKKVNEPPKKRHRKT